MKHTALVISLLLLLLSCKKETLYTYEVNEVNVQQPGVDKPNIKTDLEFISIAYTDLFGNTIPSDKLEDLSLAYVSFGDKQSIIDMIILNFMEESGVQIPSRAEMEADVESFVESSYQKFFVRQPNAFEKWFVSEKIKENSDLSPELVYYAFMTSEEYRYY